MRNQTSSSDKRGNNPERVQERSSNRSSNNRNRFRQRPPRNFWKTLITNKAFDLLIVIAGVSIAFYLNSIKVTIDKQTTETFYKQSLATDLNADIDELTKNLKEIQEDYDILISYVQQYGEGKAVGDSLANVVTKILSLDTFAGTDNTYTSLVSSDGLGIVTDNALRNLVAEYYNQYQSIKRFEDVYTKALFEMNGYFSPSIDYTVRKITDRNVLTNVRTKNNLLIVAAQLEDGIESYEDALVQAQALKKQLAFVE
jgi:hypothetical protein